MKNFEALKSKSLQAKTSAAVLLSAVVLAGCGGAEETQDPITIPDTAVDLGINQLNDKLGETVLSGRSFLVPIEDAARVDCAVLVESNTTGAENPVRRVDQVDKDLGKVIVQCLYATGPKYTSKIPVVEG